MPPRYAYWTILIDNKPTAFRAREKEELLPTLTQLRRTNKDVVMKWFARGRLWDSPEAGARGAAAAAGHPREAEPRLAAGRRAQGSARPVQEKTGRSAPGRIRTRRFVAIATSSGLLETGQAPRPSSGRPVLRAATDRRMPHPAIARGTTSRRAVLLAAIGHGAASHHRVGPRLGDRPWTGKQTRIGRSTLAATGPGSANRHLAHPAAIGHGAPNLRAAQPLAASGRGANRRARTAWRTMIARWQNKPRDNRPSAPRGARPPHKRRDDEPDQK